MGLLKVFLVVLSYKISIGPVIKNVINVQSITPLVPDFKILWVYKNWQLVLLTQANDHLVLLLPFGPVKFLLITTRMPVASKA